MFGQEELKLKRRRTVVSTVIVAVLVVFLSIDQLTVQRQTSFMTGLITQEMKQGIASAEYLAPREHFLATDRTPGYYAPNANDRGAWKSLYATVLEGLNQGVSTPLVKVYGASMFIPTFDFPAAF